MASERTPLLQRAIKSGISQIATADTKEKNLSDLEHGDAIAPENVGFLRVLRLAKPETSMLIVATVALFISSFSNILLPTFAGRIIDIVNGETDTEADKAEALHEVNNTILIIVVIVIIGALAAAIRSYLFTAASERVVARLRRNLFSHLVSQEIAFFDVTKTGELLSRLSEDTQVIKNAATVNLSEALRSMTTSLVGIGFMFHTSWRLTLLALAVIPAIFLGIRAFGRYLRELSHKTQAAAAVAASIAEESFAAVRTVRSFAQEEFECFRFGEKVSDTLTLGLKQALAVGIFTGCVSALTTLSVVAVVVYGAYLTIYNDMTTGSLTTFILYSLTGFDLIPICRVSRSVAISICRVRWL